MYYKVKSSKYDEITKLNECNRNHKQNLNNLKINKAVRLNNPIFQIKFSYRFPNFLISGDELGQISFIDSNSDKIFINEVQGNSSINTTVTTNENLNTLTYHEIKPLSKFIHIITYL